MPLDYATLAGVKRRLDITDSTDDLVLADIIADVNQDVEDMTARAIGPATVTNELIDGDDAVEDGRCLVYPKGLRTVTKLEIATERGGTFTDVTTGVLLRPSAYLRQPDWPAFELWIAEDADPSVFYEGQENIRLTAAIGWTSIPSTIVSAAETTAARTFLSNRTGTVEGSDELGVRNFRALWRGLDIRTVHRYAYKSTEII